MKKTLAWLFAACFLLTSVVAIPAGFAEEEATIPAVEENVEAPAEEEAPAAEEEAPAVEEEAPAAEEEAPAAEEEAPADEEETPAEEEEIPAVEEETPAEEEEAPAEEEETPAEEEELPADEETPADAFAAGYVRVAAGTVLYGNAALTVKAGTLKAAAILYATAEADGVLTVTYVDGDAFATAYIDAALAAALTDEEAAAQLAGEDTFTAGSVTLAAVAFAEAEAAEPETAEEPEAEIPDDTDEVIEVEIADETPLEYVLRCFEVDDPASPTTLVSYKGPAGVVTIPSGIGLTTIGPYCFSEHKGITAITVPDDITTIGVGAFNQCVGLTNIALPSTLTEIADRLFYGCTGIKTISLPPNITKIGANAFEGCTSLDGISLPSKVSEIGGGAFAYCASLSSMVFPPDVTKIGDKAFMGCVKLTQLIFNDKLVTIGEYAFATCTSVVEVTFPETLTKIGAYAFNGDTGIAVVTVPVAVTEIGEFAFDNINPNPTFQIKNKDCILRPYALGRRGHVFGETNVELYAKNHPDMVYCGKWETANFIMQVYKALLNRTVDGDSLFAWAIALDTKKESAATMVDSIVGSPEFQSRNLLFEEAVDAVYKAMLDTAPTTNESKDAVAALKDDGVSLHWLVDFIARDMNESTTKFSDKCKNDYKVDVGVVILREARDKSRGVTGFVNRAYKYILGRNFIGLNPDIDGLNNWCNALLTKKVNGARLVDEFIHSQEYTNKNKTMEETITILYKVMFDEDNPDAAGLANWKTHMDLGLSKHWLIDQFASCDGRFETICNGFGITAGRLTLTEPRDVNIQVTWFVKRAFVHLLNYSDVDGATLNNWTGKLLNREVTAGAFIQHLLVNPEYTKRNLTPTQAITAVYNVLFNRNPLSGEEAAHVNAMNNGASIFYVTNGMIASDEMTMFCQNQYKPMLPGQVASGEMRDVNLGVTSFVARCYTVVLQRPFDVSGLNTWCGQLVTKKMTARQVADQFLFSKEADGWNYTNEEFVEVCYQLYLGRTAATDPDSVNWVNALNNKILTRKQVSQQIAASDEFKTILASYGIK